MNTKGFLEIFYKSNNLTLTRETIYIRANLFSIVQECDAYCKDNKLECMKWGTENGMNSDMNDESKCITSCMVRLNVVCEQNDQKSECKQCYEECKQYRTKHADKEEN
jgi:hypothetical protein